MKIKAMPDEHTLNSLTINLINRCNTWCRYCFQNSGPFGKDYIKIRDIQRVLSFFATKQNEGERYLQLTGGEIFLHPDLFEIIQLGLSCGYTLRLQTNGLLLREIAEEKMKILSSKKVLIKVSLDGWDAETHERWRAKGSFDKVISGIKRLRKYNSNIGIKMVVHDRNFFQIHRMLDICLDLGARGFSFNFLRFEGRAEFFKDKYRFIKEEEVVKKLLPYFKKKRYQPLLNGTWIMRYYRRLLGGINTIPEVKSFYINFDGWIYPNQKCIRKEVIGSIFGEFLEKEFDFNKLTIAEVTVSEGVLENTRQIFL